MEQEMTPDARIRMEVYQEGQRAFNSGAPCPYVDWRAGTWRKGWQAACGHNEALRMAFDQIAAAPVVEEIKSAGWTIRRANGRIQIESPQGDGTTLSHRDTDGDVLRYFDDLLKENGL
jgi:hypothetical protein